MRTPLHAAALAIFVAALCPLGLRASAPEQPVAEEGPLLPVLSAYTLEAGSAHIAETYLSPLKYSGWTVALGYERAQAMKFKPEHWTSELGGRISLDGTLSNHSRNSREWRLNFDISWAMLHRWKLPFSLTLLAGGYTELTAGVYYLPSNGNNPAAAKASWNLGPRVGLVWSTSLIGKPLQLRYRADLPLGGIFFAPEYGELYYEIYLGNRRGLVHGAWPGNYFRLNQTITADIRFGGTVIRLGYAPRILSTKASHTVTRSVSHTFIFGLATEWLSLPFRSTPAETPRIISAY